ncbi:MAG: AraC family transcriptional regulator, partial [Aureispira sp.]|nr:AraC family transcriptional regulator [Aureispira sp.]
NDYLEQLLVDKNFESACELMSSFLNSDLLTRAEHKIQTVQQAIQLYQNQIEQQVSKVSGQLYVSQKTLTRYFKEILGINPKTCFNIIRLRTALKHYVEHNQSFSIYDFGYTDYSHFVKEVKKYTHHIPSQLNLLNL